jgi:hypothetical protein
MLPCGTARSLAPRPPPSDRRRASGSAGARAEDERVASWLRTRPYWIPLAFAVVIGLLGRSTDRAVEASSRVQVETKLETMLDANAAAVDVWLASQRAVARDLASDPELDRAVAEVARTLAAQGPQGLRDAPERAEIEGIVEPVLTLHGYLAWRVYDPDLVCLAASDPAAIGRVASGSREQDARVRARETFVTPPLAVETEELMAAPQGVMAIFTPLHGEDGAYLGTLALGIDAASTFSRLLAAARLGETGETYAFSREGRMLSASRFEPELRRIGLLPRDPGVGSFMRVELRDPGGDLTRGHRPALPLLARPLTRMAASAVEGGSGIDLDGYRSYRGVEVVGAWRWMPDLGLGIATEMDRDEAYAALAPVRTRTLGLIALLAVAALGMLLYSLVLRRMHGDLAEARRLGRYRIEGVLGRGGMGTVYRARHALLRRPTAVKVLRPEHVGPQAVARFEREAQVTSELTHPNTIEIFDFGRTPDGLFYYAMEYLEGATLRALVDRTGRMPDARALPILVQLCGSIAEAHRVGLVHRDIKPSNVMLCDRGGVLDYVKVLDFGLVKPLFGGMDPALTDERSLTGTPLYMPPEVIRSADALGPRSDVYQIGAVGYFLLTGHHVFQGESAVEVLEQHLNAEPVPPSVRVDGPIVPALEAVVMRCLAKSPDARPADAGALLEALDDVIVPSRWTQTDARAFWASWWAQAPHEPVADADVTPVEVGTSLDMAPRSGDVPAP